MDKEREEHIKEQIEEKTIKNIRKSTYSFKRLFHAAFNLGIDQAPYDEINERIESGIMLRGTNMCILILAIFIASVGLNMNSTAVIIGAMLVSPLMGPIMGIGFAVAIYDTNLLKRSFTILFFEVVVALTTSTVYFTLSPITTASSELLARTSPTAWDVIIAICGGLAGMIGTTRKEKSNIIPGVAIATALMPPLCTAGYGLAIGNLRYFAGAMYLFCINGIFIAIATMLITAFLRLPSKNTANEETKKQIKKRVIIIAIVAIVPSVYLASDIVKDTVFENNVSSFVEKEFQFDNTQIVKYSVDDEKKELNVAVIGTVLNDNTISNLENAMEDYHISSLTLKVQQTIVETGITSDELEQYVQNETSQLSAENEEDYKELQSQLIAAKSELSAYQQKELDVKALKEELSVLYPVVTSVSAGYLSYDATEETDNPLESPQTTEGITDKKEDQSQTSEATNSELIVILEVSKALSDSELKTISEWMKKQLSVESLTVYEKVEGIIYPSADKIPKKQTKEDTKNQEEDSNENAGTTEG